MFFHVWLSCTSSPSSSNWVNARLSKSVCWTIPNAKLEGTTSLCNLSPFTLYHSLGLSAESISPLIQGFFWTALVSKWKQMDWLILPGASGYLYFGFCWVTATRKLVWCLGRNGGQGAQYWFCCLGLCGLGQVSVSDGASACPFVIWRSWIQLSSVETVIIPLVLPSGFKGKQTPKQEAKMGNLQGGE